MIKVRSQIEYTETETEIGDANPANIALWSSDGSANGNGVSGDANSISTVTYNLTNMTASNNNGARYYETYVTEFVSDNNFTVPSSITVSMNNTIVSSANYTYEIINSSHSVLTIHSGVINAPSIMISGSAIAVE